MRSTSIRPWIILTGLALGLTVTNGFARFAYGLILPAMKEEMGWNYAQAGWLNTANALGYIIGAILTMMRSEERRVGKECRSRWSPYH